MSSVEFEKENLIGKPRKRRLWPWFLAFALLFGVFGGVMFYKAKFTFSQMQVDSERGGILPVSEDAPKIEKDPDRINILLLGIRGLDDPNGGLLTDSIMIVSVKKSTNQVAMISIPRDLYMKMPSLKDNKTPAMKEKINFAHALGEEVQSGAGLVFSKVAVSAVTGLYIDYVISIDFDAFKEIVDVLGGVDVYLDAPFKEEAQFSNEFVIDLPAGKNHLDGKTALYFIRSRYSTSDFDRAKRQQQVMLAIKEKAMSLGILLNPVKTFDLMSAMGKHIRTDMEVGEMNDILGLTKDGNFKDIRKKVFDTSDAGLLYASTNEKGSFILLPVGDNYDKIREASKNIFQ